jgi:TldD protein
MDALKSKIWIATEAKYNEALKKLIQIKSSQAMKVEDEDKSEDFSREEPHVVDSDLATTKLNRSEWEKKAKEISAVFKKYPEVFISNVTVNENLLNKYLVNTEGTRVQHGKALYSLVMFAFTKAEDGMDLVRYETFNASTPEGLPQQNVLIEKAEKIAKDLLALRKAPIIEPYAGPAILSGRASGVFFHEIFGHRVEGHRQKDESDGQTFTKQINLKVLPEFLSVYDDPTIKKIGETDLNGHYPVDDEGVKAQRVVVVQNGTFKNFLMSRAPVEGFEKSNGHGRKFPGYPSVGRQGNLIVESTKSVSDSELLIAECKKQGKPFGLYFDDISGGFTLTRRDTPQAFQVNPIMVYKVYTDGRPDELVRGVDLIGTPLTSFSKIIATGQNTDIFNGVCGAESGYIPVSAVAPSILTMQIEIQKRQKSSDQLPILPPPAHDKNQKGDSAK